MIKIWSHQWYEDNNWNVARGFLTAQNMYMSTTWIWQLKCFKGFPPLLSLWPLVWNNSPVALSQLTFFLCFPFVNCHLMRVGWLVLFLLSFIPFSKTLECYCPNIYLSYQNCGIFHDSNVWLFWDTMANVRLPEACLELVQPVGLKPKQNSVKCELNWIRERMSQIQSRTVRWIRSNKVSWINPNTMKSIKSDKLPNAELMMLMKALVPNTWRHNDRDVDAAAAFLRWF